MPPKVATGEKTYDEVIVLALLMEIKEAGLTTGNKTLERMATLHGTRTASAFQHTMRAPNKLAGELVEKVKKGEPLGPADIGRSVDGQPAPAAPNTPKKRKSAGAGGDEVGVSAAKKRRTPATKGSKPVDSGADDDDEEPKAILKTED